EKRTRTKKNPRTLPGALPRASRGKDLGPHPGPLPVAAGRGCKRESGGVLQFGELAVVIHRGEVPSQERLRLQLDLAHALARHAPPLPELFEGAGFVLREALLEDVPPQVAEAP